MNITRTQITVGCLSVVFICFFAYYKHTKQIDAEIDAKLVTIVTNELNNLHLQTDGSFVYQQVSANHNCNRSDITTVYSSNMSTSDICSSVLSSLPLQKWQPRYQWRQSKFCVDSEHPADRDKPSYIDTTLRAYNSADTIHLELRAYPKVATYTFMPVNQYAEHDIIQAAQKYGESFYYIHLSYEGGYYHNKYPCNEVNFECECIYSTYYKSTYTGIRSK